MLILFGTTPAASSDQTGTHNQPPEHLCYAAARQASAQSGVPLRVLTAIMLSETGRKKGDAVIPWPWTINAGGDGAWFSSSAEVLAEARRVQTEGRTNFDLGCFQLNYRWHSGGFASLEAMLNPDRNAAYAARFLGRLYAEFGDWTKAAAAYHSRTPSHADRYAKIFKAHLKRIEMAQPTATASASGPADPAPPVRTNRFPLLQGRIGGSTAGSLVPLAPDQNDQRLVSTVRRAW